MKHHIIVKFKEGVDWKALAAPVRALFEETLAVPGIRGVELKQGCIDRPNRYHMMIVIDMDPEALPAYDTCEPHHRWKAEYGELLEKKAIFDCE